MDGDQRLSQEAFVVGISQIVPENTLSGSLDDERREFVEVAAGG
jgi:hypothetical protein